jgi:hypothetical protein
VQHVGLVPAAHARELLHPGSIRGGACGASTAPSADAAESRGRSASSGAPTSQRAQVRRATRRRARSPRERETASSSAAACGAYQVRT